MSSPEPVISAPALQVDAATLGKLGQSGPRYTSYPTADRFSADFGYGHYLEAVAALRRRGGRRALSMYLHIPFCASICYYCACNKIITKDRDKAAVYLDYLKQEIAMQAGLLADLGQIEQLHLGGGTPTYLSDAQLAELLAALRQRFGFASDADGEYSIEIDPRTVDPDRVRALRALGFNRLSLGVQDFDADVQRAVNRIQPEADTLAVMRAAREAGFRSVSIDLIYGLPLQSVATMRTTLERVIAASPDRIALYNYAHMPHLFKPQRRIVEAQLPAPAVKLDMLGLCIATLTAAGYVYIGMDHFAKPDDELALAQQQGRLHRNFQGYSTRAETDLLACGVSAISAIGATYSQNEKTLEAYYAALDEGRLPVARGYRLDTDDLLRRIIIQALMCHFELSITAIEQAYPISFWRYFAAEADALRQLERDGLIVLEDGWINVTPGGRLLIRNICMVFDRHLARARAQAPQPLRYSKTV